MKLREKAQFHNETKSVNLTEENIRTAPVIRRRDEKISDIFANFFEKIGFKKYFQLTIYGFHFPYFVP